MRAIILKFCIAKNAHCHLSHQQEAVCAQSLSRVRLFATPWIAACHTPLSTGFSRQEYWSGLPFPSPGIFLTQGSNLHLATFTQLVAPLNFQLEIQLLVLEEQRECLWILLFFITWDFKIKRSKFVSGSRLLFVLKFPN